MVAEDIAVADVLVPVLVLVQVAVEQDAHKRTQWLRHSEICVLQTKFIYGKRE